MPLFPLHSHHETREEGNRSWTTSKGRDPICDLDGVGERYIEGRETDLARDWSTFEEVLKVLLAAHEEVTQTERDMSFRDHIDMEFARYLGIQRHSKER